MDTLLKFYKYVNIISVDVALGAVCCSVWFARLLEVAVDVQVFIVLGLAVWIIYTADRLLDVWKKGIPVSIRHRFHKRYSNQLIVAVCLMTVGVVILLFYVATAIIYAGLILSAITAGYLLLNRWLLGLKEVVIAVLYCCGIGVPVIAYGNLQSASNLEWIATGFFLTVLLNVILFSWYDYKMDKDEGGKSLAVVLGQQKTSILLVGLFVLQFTVIARIMYQGNTVAIVLAIMNLVLLLLYFKPASLQKNDHYRMVGDAVFLLPAVDWL
jgi:4-hydroxybenzoate polyprenyltransferase